MSINFKYPSWTKSLLIFMGFGTMWLAFGFNGVEAEGNNIAVKAVAAMTEQAGDASEILLCNAGFSRADLLGISNCDADDDTKGESKDAVNRIKVVLTGYSSTVAQTDSTPFITANGTYVHDGIVANNGLPFGTEIRIPEIYGNKVFSVEDRMHWRKGNYHFDIWFPTYEQAKNFGVKYAYVEVLEN